MTSFNCKQKQIVIYKQRYNQNKLIWLQKRYAKIGKKTKEA